MVRQPGGLRGGARLGELLGTQRDAVAVDRDRDLRPAGRLVRGDGPGDPPRPARVAEPTTASRARSAGTGRDLRIRGREQLPRRRHRDVRLAERRQHTADVVEEAGAGPQDQHAVRAGGVEHGEHVGGAVQRDDRLPGAGPALDHRHPPVRRADDRVLLGLERRDDLAHATRATSRHGGEQRAVADDVVASKGAGEYLVAHADDRTVVHREVAAPSQAQRGRGGRRVERACRVRPPVDEQRLAVGAGQARAADVPGGAVDAVDAAEAQAVLRCAQRGGAPRDQGEPLLAQVGGRVPPERRSLGRQPGRVGVEHREHRVDVPLLDGALSLVGGDRPGGGPGGHG